MRQHVLVLALDRYVTRRATGRDCVRVPPDSCHFRVMLDPQPSSQPCPPSPKPWRYWVPALQPLSLGPPGQA